MLTTTRVVAALVCALVLNLGPANTGLHAQDARAGQSADPATAATEIERECARLRQAAANRCYEESLLELLETSGVRAAMLTLERLAAHSERVRSDGHTYAHAIGIYAFETPANVGEVFELCTPAFQSGCYHGVIQSYFTATIAGGPPGAAAVNTLCGDYRQAEESRWLLFHCAHGMGHGLAMVAGHHLPTALGSCDLVEDPWEREACYGGVFMENIVNATVPHHTVGRPEAGADHQAAGHADHHAGTHHADHLHDHAAAFDDFPPLKAADPLYPCNALEDRYLLACYQMQTSAILFFNGQDVAGAAMACTEVPYPFRTTCFQSLGRDVSAITVQNHERARRLCASVPADYEPWCHVGYAKNLVDLTAVPGDGMDYCRLLPPSESKVRCYIAVGEEIWALGEAAERRDAACSGAEPGYVQACRFGAGTEEDPPTGLLRQ
jgi:hypothetical protein